MMEATTINAYDLLHRGSLVFSAMEHAGIHIDVGYLNDTIRKVTKQIERMGKELEADKIFHVWKRHVPNPKLGSPEQLAKIVFDIVKLADPPELTAKSRGKDAKKKRYKTDEETLRKVRHPFVEKWLEWKFLQTKVLGTYLKGIKEETVDGFLHPVFNLHTTATYRSSSDSINFQNIPTRDPRWGEIIRRCFIPRKGRHLVECDFKGIEVAVAACYNQDPTLIEYLKDKSKDMHRDMAAQSYKLDRLDLPKDWWKQKGPGGGADVRYCGKNGFVFPAFYGQYYGQIAPAMWEMISAKKLSLPDGTLLKKHLRSKGIRELGEIEGLTGDRISGRISTRPGTFLEHIRQVEADFWGRRFGVYAEWKKKWWEDYQKNGEFTTLTGFRITWAAKDKRGGLLGKNDATNYPIQGSAFHCNLWVLIRLHKWLRKNKMRTCLIGQIHDSDISDAPPNELQDYLGKMKELVTVDLPKAWPWIIVPMEVEAEICDVDCSWYEKKNWSCKDGQWGPE